MQLTLWTYEGPPHVGAMRVATALKDVHYVLHFRVFGQATSFKRRSSGRVNNSARSAAWS